VHIDVSERPWNCFPAREADRSARLETGECSKLTREKVAKTAVFYGALELVLTQTQAVMTTLYASPGLREDFAELRSGHAAGSSRRR
jgi:hypothetical protein